MGLQYGSEAQGSKIRIYRLKSDHSQLETAKPGTGIFTDIDDNELEVEIAGPLPFAPQDDGTYQLTIPVGEYEEAVDKFLENYKVLENAGTKNEYKDWTGKKHGGAGTGSSADDVFVVIHGPLAPTTNKRPVYAFPCIVEVANSGGHTLQGEDAIETTITLRQIKAKADILFHTGTGTPTTLDPTFVDVASESTDLKVLADNVKKIKHYVAPAA